jgi:hypothetical protein
MLQRFALVAVLLSALPAAADDNDPPKPPPFDVPKSWQKEYDGPNAPVFLFARGGYAVWVDQVHGKHLSPAPRAITYTFNTYRQKAGVKEPEKLDTRGSTGTVVALAGPKGEVAVGFFGNYDTIYLPGEKPLKLPKDQYHTAHHFTREGLVCTLERYAETRYQNAVVLLPISTDPAKLGEPRILRKWFDQIGADGFQPDFRHAKLH